MWYLCVLIFISDEIDRSLLRQMRSVTEKQPTPIIIFTRDSQPESINAAERLGPLLGVAKARFNEQQRLKSELKQTKKALNERKSVEKAKGIIMKTKRLSEDQACNAIRKLAMNHNKRIGEIAEQIISAAEVLV